MDICLMMRSRKQGSSRAQSSTCKRRVVLFSSAHSFYLLGAIRALGEAGYCPEIYFFGQSTFALSSRYAREKHLFDTADDCLDYLIRDYPVLEEKPILLTCYDYEAQLVDNNYESLAKKFVLPSAGGQGRIAYWMDKTRQNDLAVRHGLVVPKHIVVNKNGELPADLSYPVFTKGIRTAVGGKSDEGVFYDAEELRKKLADCVSDQVVVMQYVQKKKELDFFGLSIKNHIYDDYCEEVSRFPKKFWGFGYYEHFFRAKHDDLYAKIVSMIKETGYEGLFEVEFLVDGEGTPYFMEINFRIDGDTYKVCEGVNLPAEWCRLATLPENELPDELPLRKSEFYGMTETRDFAGCVLSGRYGFLKWLQEFATCDRLMLFNRKDPTPVFAYLWEYCRRLFHVACGKCFGE